MKSRNDFKSPSGTPDPAKKKRRTSTSGPGSSTASPSLSNPGVCELAPPQPSTSGFGDTIIASNPFDDTPSVPLRPMGPMGGPPHTPPMPPNMPVGPGVPNPNPAAMMGPGPMNMNLGPMPNGPHHGGPGPGPGPAPHPMGHPGPVGSHPHIGGPHGPGPGPGPGPGGPGIASVPGCPPNGPPMGPGSHPAMNGMHNMNQAQWNGPPKPMPIQSGKIYPHDQPMVFNPQNRNAPPIYPCGVCHKEVHDNDQAIPCESGCNFWFHRVCSGLTDASFHLLTQEVYAEWVCDKCLSTKNIPLVKFKP